MEETNRLHPDAADPEGGDLEDLLRLAGISRLEELPLDVESSIQRFLRSASGRIALQLGGAMWDPDPRTRMKAATYLGQMAREECLEGLQHGLEDIDPRVRLLCVISIRDCRRVSTIEKLISMVTDEDQRVRGAALDAIADLSNQATGGSPFASMEELQVTLRQLEEWWQERADLSREELWVEGFRTAGYAVDDLLQAPGSTVGLLEALHDDLPFVRKNAMTRLGELAGEHRTLDDELTAVDPGGERDYAAVRQEALARLVAFFRQRLPSESAGG